MSFQTALFCVPAQNFQVKIKNRKKTIDKPCLLLYNISRQLKTLRNCVMAARQTLTLFVWVQILVPQPEKAVKIDAICFDRILMRFLSIFEKFDLTKKQ